MKVTVEISANEMAEILDLNGERKKGPAIRLMEQALQQRRRTQIARRFLSGEWVVELESFEADQERHRAEELPHDMTQLLDTSLWIDLTRARRPAPGRTGAL
jgi:hypothetical protein